MENPDYSFTLVAAYNIAATIPPRIWGELLQIHYNTELKRRSCFVYVNYYCAFLAFESVHSILSFSVDTFSQICRIQVSGLWECWKSLWQFSTAHKHKGGPF